MMATRRIIADSDDEDDGFSPETSPQKRIVRSEAAAEGAAADNSSSTDSLFFQAVYDQQQESLNVVASLQFLAIAQGSSAQSDLPEQTAHIKTPSDRTSILTSVTDPIRTSARPGKTAVSNVVDLTQITTPGRRNTGPPCHDVWDVPSSPEDASLRSSKRRRKDIGTTHTFGNISESTLESTLPATSIYVEPQTLSPGRRRLYQSVQPCSSDDRTRSSQLAIQYPQLGAVDNSSGSATIEYPTPTQAKRGFAQASSGVRGSSPRIQSPLERGKRSSRKGVDPPDSSPDIISMDDVAPPSKRTPRDNLGSDNDEIPQEFYQPRPSKRRAAAVAAEEDAEEAAGGTKRALFDPGPDSLPPRKKRGRPRKADVVAAVYEADDDASTPTAVASPPAEPAVDESPSTPPVAAASEEPRKEKRKRGRPRKADKEAAAGTEAATPAADRAEIDAAEAMGQMDESRQAGVRVTEEVALHDEEGLRHEIQPAETVSRPLKDKCVNEAVGSAPPKDVSDHMGAWDEGQGKAAGRKSASREPPPPPPHLSSATTPGGKPLYRVGLSKRSRIAPLLKSLKKT